MNALPNKALLPLRLGITETGMLSNRKILVEVSVADELEEMRAINFENDKLRNEVKDAGSLAERFDSQGCRLDRRRGM
jgi:hypothetical protein